MKQDTGSETNGINNKYISVRVDTDKKETQKTPKKLSVRSQTQQAASSRQETRRQQKPRHDGKTRATRDYPSKDATSGWSARPMECTKKKQNYR